MIIFTIEHEYAGKLEVCQDINDNGHIVLWLLDHPDFVVIATNVEFGIKSLKILIDIKFDRMFMCLL